MLKKLLIVGGFAMAMAFSTGVAHADTMTVTGVTNGPSCPNCPAANYTLTVSGNLATGQDLTVTLTVNFTGAPTTGVDDFVNAVAFKIGNSATNGGTLSGAFGTAPITINSGISNAGCSGHGNGFICSSGSATVAQGTTLTWTWTGVDMGGPVSTDPSNWSLKVDYGGHDGYIISEDGLNSVPTSAPEPGTLALLGFGLIPLLGFGRRFFA
jgi:hypothetical protein